MAPSRDGEPGDSNISYPSPGAETMDAGPFYGANGRDDTQEPHDHTEQQIDDQVHDRQDQSHLHAEEDSHHDSRPASLEELQLAAQLGQGLAGAPILPATDPNMSVDDSGMRSIMPHPDSDHHTRAYVHDTPPSDHMVQHSMQVPVGTSLAHYALADGGVPPRKRSKVSRACDECRRKKIKCDAPSDTGEPPCSSCARSVIRCLFSRVPQKRGPSKGYIKELAERINSIESKLESEGGVSQDEIDKLFAADRHRGTNGAASTDDANRKRPYSSISNDFSTPVTSRQAPWGSEPRSMQPSSAPSNTNYNNSSLEPASFPINDTPSKPSEEVGDIHMEQGEHVPHIDEGVLNDFLTSVQPLYPILATSKTRQQELLAQCPLTVRTAFEIALLAVGQSTAGDVQQASALLHDWESSEAPRSRITDIVHAQTLLLLIIDADWRSVSSLPFLLSRAVGLANSMKLWKLPAVDPESEIDSDDALCTRIWWSLIGMDRWYAAGTGKPAQIPDNSVVAPAGLDTVLGETCYYFTRLSKLLNRISFVISNLPAGVATADVPMAAILADYIENYREDLPAHMDAASFPLIHLAYWHCRLLVTLLTPGSTATETLWPTKEVTQLLLATPALRSPLVNHYVSLAAMSITTLSRADKKATRDEALALAREVVDGDGDHWAGVRDRLAEVAAVASNGNGNAAASTADAGATAANHGLQHLADLATAHEGVSPADGDGAAAQPGAPAAEVADAAAAAASLATGYLEVA